MRTGLKWSNRNAVPTKLFVLLANNSPDDGMENVVPLREEALSIETGICELDSVGDAAVV